MILYLKGWPTRTLGFSPRDSSPVMLGMSLLDLTTRHSRGLGFSCMRALHWVCEWLQLPAEHTAGKSSNSKDIVFGGYLRDFFRRKCQTLKPKRGHLMGISGIRCRYIQGPLFLQIQTYWVAVKEFNLSCYLLGKLY